MAYNGWTNYETWNVALWIDNDQGSYNRRQGLAQDAYDQAEASDGFSREANAATDLEDALKEWIVDQDCPEIGPSMYSDLLSSALQEVNWREIAENFLEEVDKEEVEETEEV